MVGVDVDVVEGMRREISRTKNRMRLCLALRLTTGLTADAIA